MRKETKLVTLLIVAAATLALLPANVHAQQCLPAPEGLVGWWPADGNGTDVENGNDAILHGGAGYCSGTVDDGFSLNGVDAYIRIPNAPILNPAQQITVGAWVRATGSWVFGNQPIVTKGTPVWAEPYYQYHLGMGGDLRETSPATFGFWISTDAGRKLVATAENAWIIGNWYLVVGTYDGALVNLYVNGALAASASHTGSMSDYGNSIMIGHLSEGAPASSIFLPIDVDEPFIFSRALAAAEVEAIYAAGTAGMCKDADGDGYRPPEDCDETDATINPDGMELPGNFVDENCDGSLGECDPCFAWRNHGEYVRCVSHVVESLVAAGGITEEKGDQLVSDAARSDIGKRGYAPPDCK